jgi:hypothetical protein
MVKAVVFLVGMYETNSKNEVFVEFFLEIFIYFREKSHDLVQLVHWFFYSSADAPAARSQEMAGKC